MVELVLPYVALKLKKSKASRCGGVVFLTDYNTILRLHWVTLGCGNKIDFHSMWVDVDFVFFKVYGNRLILFLKFTSKRSNSHIVLKNCCCQDFANLGHKNQLGKNYYSYLGWSRRE